MGGANAPFLYQTERYSYSDGGRFPESPFDPKAVTRASWETKPRVQTPKKDGPLVSFNRHPDTHEVLGPRKPFKTLGPRTKRWIQQMRGVQLGLRGLELMAAIGVLFLMIIISNVDNLTAWILRITAGVVMIHCVYSLYHHSQPAGRRSPASSAAYQLFSAVSDLCVLPLYAFGLMAIRNNSAKWETLLANQDLTDAYFVPALYYNLISAAGLHFLSLAISLWLSIVFKQVSRMPPDLNPLESHLTSRHHKRNKSSVAISSLAEAEHRLDSPLEDRRRSGLPYEDLNRPPSVPFFATRSSIGSSQGSQIDPPSRQYQVTPGTSPKNSPRNPGTPADLDPLRRMPLAPSSPSNSNRSPWRRSYGPSYAEVPLYDLNSPLATGSPGNSRERSQHPRASTGTVASQVIIEGTSNTTQPRSAKFTEAWYTSESLINRTQERKRAEAALEAANEKKRREYERLKQRYDALDNDDESHYSDLEPEDYENDENDEADGDLSSSQHHPNPLRSNPSLANVNSTSATTTPSNGRKPNTPFIPRGGALTDIDLNDRRVGGGGQDITDEKPGGFGGGLLKSTLSRSSKRYTWAPGAALSPRNRDSSIQPESEFYSKPYGELKAATPPLVIGTDRQVSSGNDYDMGSSGANRGVGQYFSFGKRNVSGKVAEEGLGGRGTVF